MKTEKPKNFALIGAAGYIAPRHMKAIKETGNQLLAALDPFDSVGIMDSYFPDAAFFTEPERFDRHLDKLRRQGKDVIDYVSVCSPNYLHDAHIRMALRNDAHAICEKPIVLNPWNVDALSELENETGKRIYTILQLRHHPSIIALKEKIDSLQEAAGTDPETRNKEQETRNKKQETRNKKQETRNKEQETRNKEQETRNKKQETRNKEQETRNPKPYNIELTYITSRGSWYQRSWKGRTEKSGGIATNIGVHFFDMLLWVFGAVKSNHVDQYASDHASGYLELENARVKWFLSINANDLPGKAIKNGQTTYRSLKLDGEEIEFSGGFTDLHTESYRNILAGNAFGLSDARPSIQLVHDIRNHKNLT